MTTYAVFGIGSTNFRYALGTGEGELLTDLSIDPTDHDDLAAQIVDAIRDLRDGGRSPAAACISCAGLVDADAGVVELMHTPDGGPIRDLDVAGAIRDAFDLPTYIRNDCTTAVIGEHAFGAGRDYDTVAHVTMGTGIGAGVIDHGHLLRGERGHAAEVGYAPLVYDGALEGAGVRGAWEAYCSGRGIPGFVERLLDDEERATALRDVDQLGAEAVFGAADDGDPVAEDYVDRIARLNAAGIATVANLYDPGVLTLGGGIVLHNEERVLGGIRRHLDDYLLTEGPEVRVTDLGGDIGIYGAMALPDWTE